MHSRKQPLRARLIAERRSIDAARVESGSAAIADALLALPELAGVQTIALYQSMRGEVETAPLWRRLTAAGVGCLFPRVVRGSRILAFAPVDDAAELVIGGMGIREPPPGGDRDLAGIDLFVVPGLAFDERGGRLGHGAGYYDTTLAAAPGALRVGVCLDWQLLPEVPVEGHDEPVDLVVTPTRTFRSNRRPLGMLKDPA